MLQTLNNQGSQRVVRTKSSQNMYEVFHTNSQENPASVEEAGFWAFWALSGETLVRQVIQPRDIQVFPFSGQLCVHFQDHGDIRVPHPGLECFDRDIGLIAHGTEGHPEVMTADVDIVPGG